MHHVFVELRLLGRAGKARQVADLADAVHNLPIEMYDSASFDWGLLKSGFDDYRRKYHREAYTGMRDYVSMIEEIRRTA